MTDRNEGGRPQHKPDEKSRVQVKMLAAMGIGVDDIAKVVGVSAPTLRKHYEHEIEIGRIEANAKVAGSLFKAATANDKGSVAAAIFWLKTRAGWREEQAERAPRDSSPQPVGKKEQAAQDALTAQAGTDWEHLLGRPSGQQVQ